MYNPATSYSASVDANHEYEKYKTVFENGKGYKINRATGEAKELIQIYVEPGSEIISPEQKAARKAYIELQAQKQEKRRAESALGSFYFILTANLFPNLSPQNVARMIMLCTYLGYDGRLMINPKRQMQRKELGFILKLKPTQSYYFWNEVKDKYIGEDNNGLFILPDIGCFRGEIPQDIKGQLLQKIFIQTVRALYIKTDVRKHRQLGYVFKLLPYINIRYNIFCKDALEENLDLVEPLTVAGICFLLGYDLTQAARLIKELQQLTYINRNKDGLEYLISYVDNGSGKPSSRKIFVNPHVIYNGKDYKQVEILGSFCQVD